MSDYITFLRDFFESYKKWVSTNPEFVSDVETTAKWISYFVAGRISSSSIISELVYSLSNILVLLNDRIIEKAYNPGNAAVNENAGNRLKLMLTTLEYCEVFIEISTKKLWGERGRWFFIIIVQFLKYLGRLILIRRYSESIITVPLIPVLDRKNVRQNANSTADALVTNNDDISPSFLFKLKRSGRMVRKIEGAPPFHMRNWNSLQNELEMLSSSSSSGNLDYHIRMAENLYIAKPLIHLLSIGLFGYKSWKSYSTSLLIDLASIRLYYNNREKLTKQQKVELSRRCVNLLMYFVRSPFYNRFSERSLIGFFNGVARNIPLTKGLCDPIAQYIPVWQDTYFYMWSS